MDVQVKTKPNAFVAILAVDQAILLLDKGPGHHDIRREDVINELATYDNAKPEKPSWYRKRKKRSSQWMSSLTAGEVLDQSGVIMLTDAKIHRYTPNSKLIFSNRK